MGETEKKKEVHPASRLCRVGAVIKDRPLATNNAKMITEICLSILTHMVSGCDTTSISLVISELEQMSSARWGQEQTGQAILCKEEGGDNASSLAERT